MNTLKAMIFDLDGTVCDTLRDVADCCNRALEDSGFPAHPVKNYCNIVGNGVDKQIERAIPKEAYTAEVALRVKTAFIDYYDKGWKTFTKPYDGMLESIAELKSRGYILILFSNKPDAFTQRFGRDFFPQTFDVVAGNSEGRPVKPNPIVLLEQLQKMGVLVENCLYCGDSDVDMQTAKNANITSIGALWGFRTREELLENGADFLAKFPADLPLIARKWEESRM